MAVRAEYKLLLKVAREEGVQTRCELEDILCDARLYNAEISGGEFECAVKALKL